VSKKEPLGGKMWKKSTWLICGICVSLIACNSNQNTNNGASTGGANQPVSTTPPPEAKLNSGFIQPKTIEGENATSAPAAEPLPVNVELGNSITLPADVPIYPGAIKLVTRQTNKICIFDYRASTEIKNVNEFYIKELDRAGWKAQTQQSNSTDGLLYEKAGKVLRIITTRNPKENATDIHFYMTGLIASTPTPGTPNNAPNGALDEETKKKYIASLGDVLKVPTTVPNDVPIYPSGQERIARKAHWREYAIKDSVNTIAGWYSDKMSQNGWAVELDTSELGDSMRIYKKRDEQGNKRTIGIRVNNIKESDERVLTIILFPNNVVTPQVEPTSKVAARQNESSKKPENEGNASTVEKPKN
jgi:hypothetical protein